MAKKGTKISQNKRLEMIRKQLLGEGEIFVDKMAKKFNVSLMTVHRDLDMLEKAGEIIKTHGGATAAKRLTFEFSFRDQVLNQLNEKEKIAQKAVEFIAPGDVVMLDTGTTTLEIARKLKCKENITVITTSLAIVSELQFVEKLEVILLGGYLRRGSPDMHGPLTEDNIERFNANLAFIGADGINYNGDTFTDDVRIMALSRRMAKNADKVIVVSDSSKIGRKSMCKVLSEKEYDFIITDSHAGQKILSKLELDKGKLTIV